MNLWKKILPSMEESGKTRYSDEPISKGMTQKLINRSYSSAVGQTG